MTGLIGDLRHAIKVYRSTPIASGIAVAALAVAMGFVSAFLSMWSDVALKPPEGFERSGRLVTIGQSGGYAAADSSAPLTLDIIEGIDATVSSLEFAAGVTSFPQSLRLDDGEQAIQAEAVTRNFSDLRPRLLLGSLFDEQDHVPDAEPAVILSHRLWLAHFGGREDVIGETARISEIGFNVPARATTTAGDRRPPEARGQDYRIVGVMSPQMTGTFADAIDVWLPYEQAVPFLYGLPEAGSQRELGVSGLITSPAGSGNTPTRMRGIARLASGVGAEAASNELNARLEIEGQALAQGLNLSGEEIRFDAIEGVVRDNGIQRESRGQVRLFLLGTLLLAVVAACNISLFLLARASRRRRELGIRMAVGASTRRLARQLASEAALLILLATAAGIAISLWLSVVLRELPFLQQAEWRDVSPFDWRVLAMLAAFMLLLTLLVSLAPLFGLRRMGIGASSAMVTGRAGWGQRLAGTVQITLTGVVGAVAAAFAWHLFHFATADRGFDAEDVLVVELERAPVTASPGAPVTQTSAVVDRERRRDVVAGLPGVEDASFASYAPGGAGNASFTIIQRESGEYVEYGTTYTDDHYLDVLDIPLAYGSNMNPNDPLQLVGNETYAIDRFGRANAAGEVTTTNYTVRGVFRDVAFGHPAEAVLPMGLSAWPQSFYPLLLVETSLRPAALRSMLEEKIATGELEFALGDIHRLADVAGRDLLPDRARAALTASSALIVVILAAFGFYGTQRYLVTAGQREYAIRASFGAGPRRLGRLVLSRGLTLAVPGLILGALLAFISVAWLRDGFVTGAVPPVTVVGLAMLVTAAIMLAATLGPARQARSIAPAVLLRED